MPTYEFRLPDGSIIERSFKISEVPDEIPNPNGEGAAVRIISGGAGLLFKGSGFYLTDYGRNAHRTQGEAPKPAASGTSGESSSGESSSGAKTEVSSGTTSEPKTPAAPKAEPRSSGSGTSDS